MNRSNVMSKVLGLCALSYAGLLLIPAILYPGGKSFWTLTCCHLLAAGLYITKWTGKYIQFI